jgi:hypothetical protein
LNAWRFGGTAGFKEIVWQFRPEIRKALINSDEHLSGRCLMRNHDIVSNGFLALTTASFVLLCSSLLAFALG